ncbi:hypothetical protein Y981_08320 [Leptospirillum ferriphilum YSK]|uniref:Uncharacterized protein n=1 Tax=Leptospirillum ferriphilum YSK TaxID=1441628 RepID=A0A059Y2W0_9BACT|nr:hypothetical protein Y981_08320 [Leptospirillum ferriphilum YSK]
MVHAGGMNRMVSGGVHEDKEAFPSFLPRCHGLKSRVRHGTIIRKHPIKKVQRIREETSLRPMTINPDTIRHVPQKYQGPCPWNSGKKGTLPKRETEGGPGFFRHLPLSPLRHGNRKDLS